MIEYYDQILDSVTENYDGGDYAVTLLDDDGEVSIQLSPVAFDGDPFDPPVVASVNIDLENYIEKIITDLNSQAEAAHI